MNKWLFYISLFFTSFGFGQNDSILSVPNGTEPDIIDYIQVYPLIQEFQTLNYRSQIENSGVNFYRSEKVHSGVKPMLIHFSSNAREGSKLSVTRRDSDANYFTVYPIADISGGIEIGNQSVPDYSLGAGVGVDFSTKKFIFTAKGLPYYSSTGLLRDSLQSNFNMDAGTNRALTSNLFYKAELLAAFKANKFFTFMGGYGKNFFGNGYRSVLLSDNAGAHPFFKIETSFAGIKYVNLYNIWRDNTTDPFDRSVDIPKFASTHYLSWNITKDFNISVFEAVVFQSRDTITNRGFDVNYLNPIVFYRPVEYGLGSSDNVLLGLDMSYKLNNHHNFYAQFLLDEFYLKEIMARSRWWANKYAWQIGYKSDAFFKENLYFQLELNGVRPYTYSHKFSQHAYGHMNAPVAHPVGANFIELLNIVSFKTKKHRITNKLTFVTYGADDTSNVSYGQNIFESYTNRPGEYDHLLFQGVRRNVLNETFIYEYELFPKINMYLTAKYNWRMANTSLGTDHLHTFQIGLKSRIWNSYTDF